MAFTEGLRKVVEYAPQDASATWPGPGRLDGTSGCRSDAMTRSSKLSAQGALSPSAERVEGAAPKHLVLRSVKVPATLVVGLLVLALAAFGVIAWRGLQHLDPVHNHLKVLTRLQETGLRLEELTVKGMNGTRLSPEMLEPLSREIASVAALDGYLAPDTAERLGAAQTALSDPALAPKQALLTALKQMRKVQRDETRVHDELLTQVRHDMILEFSAAGTAVVLFGGVGLLTLVAARKRIFRPLATLEHLLALLAKRGYSFAPTEDVDPIVLPLTTSYNELVKRLIDLEEENARYRESLEQEIRAVTTALLEQHRSLAAAERLAATGEVAARIAHELRNPLAGMQMALSNIRTECRDRQDLVGRLDFVIDELRRVTGLLNGLLDQSRITPEPNVDLPIAKVVGELLSIIRYQIPRQIELSKEIPDDLVCHLPRDRFRQMLLNLVLNSAEAIGDRPGTIMIVASVADGMMNLTVTDDGPGFPGEFLSEGVGTFRTHRPGGTGLGLSIVSRLVRNLEGRMELSNVAPHGACVGLVLPCRGAHG